MRTLLLLFTTLIASTISFRRVWPNVEIPDWCIQVNASEVEYITDSMRHPPPSSHHVRRDFNGNPCFMITADPGYVVVLNFTYIQLDYGVRPSPWWAPSRSFTSRIFAGEFDLDRLHHDDDDPDYLKTTLHTLSIFHSNFTNRPVMTSDNKMFVVLLPSYFNSSFRFNASISQDFDECRVNNGGCEHKCTNTYGSNECACHYSFSLDENGRNCTCNNTITEEELEGRIYSPRDSLGYSVDSYGFDFNGTCMWRITKPQGERVRLEFRGIILNPFEGESMKVYNGLIEDDSQLIQSYGYNGLSNHHFENGLPPILSRGNEMLVVFKKVDFGDFIAYHSIA